jgi:hypothetical protein
VSLSLLLKLCVAVYLWVMSECLNDTYMAVVRISKMAIPLALFTKVLFFFKWTFGKWTTVGKLDV